MQNFLNTPHQVYAVAIVIAACLIAVGLNWLGENVKDGLAAYKQKAEDNGDVVTTIYQRDTSKLVLTELTEFFFSDDSSFAYQIQRGYEAIRIERVESSPGKAYTKRLRVTLAKISK